jgi:hypothetical protein
MMETLITVPAVPATLDDFLAYRDAVSQTPQGGAAVMVLALLLYAEDPDGDLGRQALTLAVDRSRLRPDPDGIKGWGLGQRDHDHIRRQMRAHPHAPRSYVQGTTPDEGYRLPAPPLQIRVLETPHSGDEDEGRYKVFVASSGADSPRPVTLQRNNRGLWKAVAWSSLTMGVKPPATPVDDDL